MPGIHLVEGPVGAGKSTYAGSLALRLAGVHLNLDEWMVNLFRPDRPRDDFMAWYAERKDRCLEQIWAVTCEIMAAEQDVVLELGLVQRAARDAFYQRVAASDFELHVYWLDVPVDVRRARVMTRNDQQGPTFRMAVSEEMFEIANNAWEAPDEDECRARNITVI
jgi:predicted kinase